MEGKRDLATVQPILGQPILTSTTIVQEGCTFPVKKAEKKQRTIFSNLQNKVLGYLRNDQRQL